MQLLSVNVSLPVDINVNNQPISTGIFKKPVNGSVTVSQFNLAGDQQVDLENHGGGHKAVYGFSANEYDYWQDVLNQENLPYGKFGENLTISDLSEANLCIGDQLQINDCILEITQPRVPCFKLGIVFNDKLFPKRFIKHAATGIYFKVLQTGTIQSGNEVTLVHQHSAKLSVQTLFKAYFDKDFVNADEIINLATTIPELSDEWSKKVVARANKS